jgi:hypothetical protein
MVFLIRLCQIIHVGMYKIAYGMSFDCNRSCGGASCQTDGGGTRQLQLDHSTLNRRLAALERDLSTKLFDRGVPGYALMPHGGDVTPA